MNLSKNNSLILLHIIIVIWGFTGILGKLITLESYAIVLNRMSLSFIALFFIKISVFYVSDRRDVVSSNVIGT